MSKVMKKASVLLLFGLLLMGCASTSGHRLVRLDRYRYGKLSGYETYQYEDSDLVAMTRVSYYDRENIDTVYYSYQTNQVGDIIEEVEYRTVVSKEGVKKSKYVSRSDGTTSSYTLVGDEWFEWGWSRSDEQGRILEGTVDNRHYSYTYDSLGRQTVVRIDVSDADGVVRQLVDSMVYSADGLQTTLIMTSQEVDSPAFIYYLTNKTFDAKGRLIFQEQFNLDETDDEHPSYNSYKYRYTKRRVIVTYLDNKYKKGRYERPFHKVKSAYNKRGLKTKMVDSQIKFGFAWRESLIKYKYDSETADPLKETHYRLFGFPLFRMLSYKIVWTYE